VDKETGLVAREPTILGVQAMNGTAKRGGRCGGGNSWGMKNSIKSKKPNVVEKTHTGKPKMGNVMAPAKKRAKNLGNAVALTNLPSGANGNDRDLKVEEPFKNSRAMAVLDGKGT